MIEFIIPANKSFHLFWVNCTKCGLIAVSRIAFHICGPRSRYSSEHPEEKKWSPLVADLNTTALAPKTP